MSEPVHNPLLHWQSEDARALIEIARLWGKTANDLPTLMMDALIGAFWRGEFERIGHSSLFALLQPESTHHDGSPGSYGTRSDRIVKVGVDFRPYPTAERMKAQIFRREVAEVLCAHDWDRTDAGFLGLATIPYESWPEDMRELHYSRWRIGRPEFATWYLSTALLTEARLEQFWPPKSIVPPMRKRGRSPTIQYEVLKTEFFRLMDYHGDISAYDPEWNSKERVIDALQRFYSESQNAEVSRPSLQPRVNKWLTEWRGR